MSTIMIVDDHPIIRESLKVMIDMQPQLEVVAVANDGIDAQNKLNHLSQLPDLILVDLQLPRMSGVEFIQQLHGRMPVVVLSTEINPEIVLHMVNYGVRGYLLKSEEPNVIVTELAKLAEDKHYVAVSNAVTREMMLLTQQQKPQIDLTPKQVELLRQVADGMTNKEIAQRMFVTDRTVKLYLTEIYETLDVSNRAQAIAVASREGII